MANVYLIWYSSLFSISSQANWEINGYVFKYDKVILNENYTAKSDLWGCENHRRADKGFFSFYFFLFFSFLFVFYIIKGKKKPVTVKLHKHCYRLTWSYGTSKPWSLLPSVKGPQEKAAPKSADAGSHLLAPERKVCALWYSRAERTCLRAMTESEQPRLSCRQVGTSWCVSF